MSHSMVKMYDFLTDQAMRLYTFSDAVRAKLLCSSENTTYLVEDPESGFKGAMRIAEFGYHTKEELEGELLFMDYIRKHTDVKVPQAVPGRNRRLVQRVRCPISLQETYCVLFTFLEGSAPDESSPEKQAPLYESLGEITAKFHTVSQMFALEKKVDRFEWNYDTLIGDISAVGNWRDYSVFSPQDKKLLEAACQEIRTRLAGYDKGSSRYGLVHADLRLANLILDGDSIAVIDFDDCGKGWFLLDYSSAFSFFEDSACVGELTEAWVKGYERIRRLSREDRNEMPMFLLMRRLLLCGFLAKHPDSAAARSIDPRDYASGAVRMAEKFLYQM